MTIFDERLAKAWEAEQQKIFGARQYSSVVSDVLDEMYKEMPQDDADMDIYKSDSYSSSVSMGTALAIQRRIILRLLPAT